MHLLAVEGAVATLGTKRAAIQDIRFLRIKDGQIGRHTGQQGAKRHPKYACGIAGDLGDGLQRAQDTFSDQAKNQRDRRFQTDHAICCKLEFRILFDSTVRGMIRRDRIDCAVRQTLFDGFNISGTREAEG